MADDNGKPNLDTGGKESTAYRLMHDIMVTEDVALYSFAESQGLKRADRNYMLSLYADCLKATAGSAVAAAKASAAAPAKAVAKKIAK